MKRMIAFIMAVLMLLTTGGCAGQSSVPASPTQPEQPTQSAQPSESTAGVTADEKIRPVKIAILDPFSGANAFAGQLNHEGMQLAVEICNENGGIKSLGGAPVEIVVGDVTSDPSEAKTVAERVLVDEDIMAVIASISPVLVPALPVIEKLGIPAVVTAGSAGIVDQGYQYVFRPVVPGEEFGLINLKFLDALFQEGELKTKNIAIISEDSAWGITTADGVRQNAEKFGFNIVMDEYYAQGLTDASSLIIQLVSSGAEVVICNSYLQETKLIVGTMKSMGIDNILICGGGSGFLLAEFGNSLGDDVNGIISASNCSPDVTSIVNNPKFADIPERFRQKYGNFMNQFSLGAFSLTQLIIDAIEMSGSRDRTVLRDVIRANEWEVMWPYGTCRFDENGQNSNVTPIVIQWQDNEPRGVYPYDVCTFKYMKPGD